MFLNAMRGLFRTLRSSAETLYTALYVLHLSESFDTVEAVLLTYLFLSIVFSCTASSAVNLTFRVKQVWSTVRQ